MEQLPTPHNNFFHFALSHLPSARSLIETQLNEAALAELDLKSLKLVDGSFVDSDLTERFSDLLMSVQRSSTLQHRSVNETLIYFLFEHKSQSDRLTVFQLLSYMVRIWEKRLRDGLDLCPIIPLVVYHGETGWRGAKNLRELLDTPEGLAPYQIDFQMPLLDLSQLDDDEIAGEPILQSTLQLLKYSRSQLLGSLLGDLLQRISKSLPESLFPEWVRAIGVYVMTVNKDIGAEEYKRTLEGILPTQFETGSLADRLLTQGREEGLEQGLEQGLEKGIEKGLEKGKLAGKILMLQDLLGEPCTTDTEFQASSVEELNIQLTGLQQRLRDRQV